MENQSQPPTKQAKPLSSPEPSLAKSVPEQRIPKNTYLRFGYWSAFRKSRINNCPWALSTNKIYWKYVQYIKKVHKWTFFKEIQFGYNNPLEENLLSPSYDQDFSIKTLRVHPGIKKLSLLFNWEHDITDEYLETLIFEVCHNLKLEELTFRISQCEHIKLDTLKYILLCIAKHQPNLKKLSFHTQTFPRIDNEGLAFFNHVIRRYLTNLRSLDLCFNEKIKYYLNMPAPFIEEFKVLKGKTPISDKGLKALGYKLGRNLPYLRELTIEINWVKEISDKGVKTLVLEMGKDVKNLRSLELQFRDCQSLTGSGMKAVANEICKNFKKLESLNFSFDKCQQVFANDIKAVNNKLRKELTGLKKFELNNTQIIKSTGVFA